MSDRSKPSSPEILAVACGNGHAIAVLDSEIGRIVATWGSGDDGQLGHGDTRERDAPQVVLALMGKDVDLVSCGGDHCVASSSSRRETYSWGWGDFGRLGHAQADDVWTPKPIRGLSGLTLAQVACGDMHTLALTVDGAVYAFGRNQAGQLGIPSQYDALEPTRVAALEGKHVRQVSCGGEHSLAVVEGGQLYVWGWGKYGNLGLGNELDHRLPVHVEVPGAPTITTACCGWRHTAAVDAEGRLYTWGWNKYGQLGLGNHENQSRPSLVSSLSTSAVHSVSGGWRHTLVIAGPQHEVFAWGWNRFGQLGLDGIQDCSRPCRIRGELEGCSVRSVQAGWRHSIAVTREGEVYVWGRGASGVLGLGGREEDQLMPTRLVSLSRGTAELGDLMTQQTVPEADAASKYGLVPEQAGEEAGGVVPDYNVEAKRSRV
ncbi:UVR8 [Auxenochlorella protothecoides x Auxenochlorella symbiontica]